MKGSITLESSLVYPLIFFISVLLILYSFFVHDKLILKSDIYRILMEDYSSDSPNAASDIEQRLNEKCLLSYTYDIDYQTENNSISLQANSSSISNIWLKLSFTGYERCDYIRKYFAILNLLNK